MNKCCGNKAELLSRIDEILEASKVNELLGRKKVEEKKTCKWVWVLAIIGAITVIAGVAYAVYRYMTPDYLEDFDDDFEDDFEDDFFENEDDDEMDE